MPEIKKENGIYNYINDFTGGYNQFLDPTKIGENEFTIFENLILYSPGSVLNAIKRKGFERYNTNAVTGGTSILSLAEYIYSPTGTSYLMAKTNSKLNYCSGTGTFTDVVDSINNDEASVDKKVKMLVFNDNVYIFDRNDGTNWYQNKVFRKGDIYQDTGLEPAPQNFKVELFPTLGTTRTLLTPGTYFYIVTFLYDDEQESYVIPNTNYSSSADHAFPDATYGGNVIFTAQNAYANVLVSGSNCIKLTLPTGNARVTGRKIYRAFGVGSAFYELTTIKNNTTTVYVDDIPTADLTNPMDIRFIPKPAKARYGCIHKERLFLGDLRESLYDPAPIITHITETAGEDLEGTGYLTHMGTGARRFKYSYKFYNFYEISSAINSGGLPISGFLGKVSNTFTAEANNSADNSLQLGIPNSGTNNVYVNKWSRKLLLERNCCDFVAGVTAVGADITMTLEMPDSGVHCFQAGEIVTISGITGFINNPNGTFTLTNIDATHIYFTATNVLGGGSYDSGTGRVEGGNFYYLGVTAIDGSILIDDLADTSLLGNAGLLEIHNVEKLTEEKVLHSTLQFSEPNSGDNFQGENSIDINSKDNDFITGLLSVDNGVIIFKERNIYKLYTTSVPAQWEARKIISGYGCSSGYTVIAVDDNKIFFYGNGVFYMWNERMEKPAVLSEPVNTIVSSSLFGELQGTHYNYKDKNWLIYTYNISGEGGSVGNVLIFDLNVKKWYNFVKYTTDLGLICPLATKAGSLFFGSNEAKIYTYGSNNQDTIAGTAKQILVKLQTRAYDFNQCDVKRILAKIKSSGTGTADQLIIIPIINGTDGTNLTDTLAGSLTRIKKKCNYQMNKNFAYRFQNAENLGLEFQEIGMLYEPIHTEEIIV